MPTLLVLDSSADLADSVSRRLTRLFVDVWRERESTGAVVYRDLHRDPPPHLADSELHWAPHLRARPAAVPQAAIDLQRELIDELLAADVVVIGAPMYDWSLPSTLKAWIDHVHVVGLTAPFDENTAPLEGKRAVVVSSRGDRYGAGTANPASDHTVPPLVTLLEEAFGMHVEVILAELTLAERIPELHPLIAESAAGLHLARAAVRDAATRLSG